VPDDGYPLSASDAGQYLGVHPETIKRWARAGTLASKKTPGGRYRFRTDDLDAVMVSPEYDGAA
jgi:excisionase family DNA binding protein